MEWFSRLTKTNTFTLTDSLFVIVLAVAIFLRVWQIETHLIFFPDIGRDLLAARQMKESGEIPLLGIPSSVPRFKQGPLMVWFLAFVLWISNDSLIAVGYSVTLLSILTIVLMYLFVRKQINATAAVCCCAFFAVSPLIVAHARMPYHTSPIAFAMMCFVIALAQLKENRPYATLLSTLAWTFVFQFELAAFPLFILIPLVLGRKKLLQLPHNIQILSGLCIGLLPQIIYDLTHQFGQLGGFLIWVMYRIVSFLGYDSAHTASISKFSTTLEIFAEYFTRIVVGENLALTTVLIVLCTSFALYKALYKKRLQIPRRWSLFAIVSAVILLLTISFFVHSGPSEAYFTLFFTPFALFCGIFFESILRPHRVVLFAIFSALAVHNISVILNNNFFVLPSDSFHYGPSMSQQQKAVDFILSDANGRPFVLKSSDPDAHFTSYLDGYRFLTTLAKNPEQPDQAVLIYTINRSDKKSEPVVPGTTHIIGPIQVIRQE